MTFDMEKAREAVHILENFAFASGKITTGQIQDILWGARLLAGASTEIERLRGFKIAARDLSDTLTNVARERDELKEQVSALVEIADRQAARIKELEDALAEQEARFQYYVQNENCESWPEARQRYPELNEKYIGIARQQLQAEGKIGPDAALKKQWDEVLDEAAIHKKMEELPTAPGAYRPAIREEAIKQMGAKPRSWRITDERTAALRHLVAICPYENCSATGIIKAMLEEAGQ